VGCYVSKAKAKKTPQKTKMSVRVCDGAGFVQLRG
jgi:hypothetical protein